MNNQVDDKKETVEITYDNKSDCSPIDTKKAKGNSTDKEKDRTDLKSKKIIKKQSDTNVKTGNEKNLGRKSRSNSFEPKNTDLQIKDKKVNKSKLLIDKNSKIKRDNKKSISRKTTQDDSEILKENQSLKNQVNELEKKLNDLNEQLKLDNLERKGKDYLRIELEMWKNKSENITKNYVQTLTSLKNQISEDKTIFVEKINTMQNEYTNEINSLKDKYQHTLEKLENSVKLHKTENENLKKKISKLKEILN